MGSTALLSFATGKNVEIQQTILFVTFGFEALLLLHGCLLLYFNKRCKSQLQIEKRFF
jgi:hypothetical protein